MFWKFLDPSLCTHYNGKAYPYAVPAPGEKWGPWNRHPDPFSADGRACGPGRLHLMKNLDAQHAPMNWWPWAAQGQGLVGEDREKAGFIEIRLRRVTPKVLHRVLCPPFDWGRRANLRGADLRGADLREADLREADLTGADLRGADLREADLREADLTGANLWRADLRGANLRRANLRGADLTGANLRRADLRGANLRGANLWRADLREADLREADLTGADLRGADLRGANLRGAEHNEITLWPSGYDVVQATGTRLLKEDPDAA